jgi:Fe-S cluster assembly iron-binding protein IscA
MTLNIDVTNEAKSKVQELIRAQKPGTAVRVFVQAGGGGGCGCGSEGGGGGGCCGEGGASSGPSFGMAFDKVRTGDAVVKVDGFSVVADSATAEMIEGAKIDFVSELDQSGFRIIPKDGPIPPSPSAGGGGGCGCGSGGGCC